LLNYAQTNNEIKLRFQCFFMLLNEIFLSHVYRNIANTFATLNAAVWF